MKASGRRRRGLPWARRLEGPPVRAGGWTLTPLTGRLELRLPVVGAEWTFPLGFRAEHQDGRRRVRRVVDVTRCWQGGLLVAGVVLGHLLARMTPSPRPRFIHELLRRQP